MLLTNHLLLLLQMKGIAESAAKSTDELFTHTKKSLDDMTSSSAQQKMHC